MDLSIYIIIKMVQDFKKLKIWQESFDIGLDIYKTVIPGLPKEEVYGISSQLRRALVSISSNIAEGTGKKTSRDFASYIYNALGSTKECENLLLFAYKLGYISENKYKEFETKIIHLGGKLYNFIQSVEGAKD
jgi:four helix bundle protein